VWMLMKKNRPGILELGLAGLLLGAGNIVLGITCGLWVPVPVLIAYLFLNCWLLYYIVHKSKSVPGAGLYNPLGVIELHVNNFAKGNRRTFIKLCAVTILYARDCNKPVMFCTPLLDEQTLRGLFMEALTLYRPSPLERALAFFNDLVFGLKRRYPLVKGMIDTGKIPPAAWELLNRYADIGRIRSA
jgi:hypothetical protein